MCSFLLLLIVFLSGGHRVEVVPGSRNRLFNVPTEHSAMFREQLLMFRRNIFASKMVAGRVLMLLSNIKGVTVTRLGVTGTRMDCHR